MNILYILKIKKIFLKLAYLTILALFAYSPLSFAHAEVLWLEEMVKIDAKAQGNNAGKGGDIYWNPSTQEKWFIKRSTCGSANSTSLGTSQCAEFVPYYFTSRILQYLVGPESIPVIAPVYSREASALLIGSLKLEGFQPLATEEEPRKKIAAGKEALLNVALSLLNIYERHVSNRGEFLLGDRTIAAMVDRDARDFKETDHFCTDKKELEFHRALQGDFNYKEAFHRIAMVTDEELMTIIEGAEAELSDMAFPLSDGSLYHFDIPFSWNKKAFLSSIFENLSFIQAMDEFLHLASFDSKEMNVARYAKARDPHGFLLWKAIDQERFDIVDHFLDHHRSLDPKGRALRAAILFRDGELVKKLYESGISQDPERRALKIAVEANSLPLVQYFFANGYSSLRDLKLAFKEAVLNDSLPMAGYLLALVEQDFFPRESAAFKEEFRLSLDFPPSIEYTSFLEFILRVGEPSALKFVLDLDLVQDLQGALTLALTLLRWDMAQLLLESSAMPDKPEKINPEVLLEGVPPAPLLLKLLEKRFFEELSLLKTAIEWRSFPMLKFFVEECGLEGTSGEAISWALTTSHNSGDPDSRKILSYLLERASIWTRLNIWCFQFLQSVSFLFPA